MTCPDWLRRWLLPLLALLMVGSAFADAPGRVGRLADLQGTVWFFDIESGEWVAARRNRPLTSGDRIATERDGRAELRIGSTTVRVGASTDLELPRLDDDRITLHLHAGSLAARLRTRETANDFELRTQEGRFLTLRPGHYRFDREPDISSAGVWSGSLRFDAPDSTLDVAGGQRAEFWQQGGVSHYTWTGLPGDRFADWVLAEDERDERHAANRHVSPEMTGWEDLDRHGRWDRHPQYGVVWVPVGVSAGWAPYRYGQWVWRRPWGWTWVDDSPWGFAPFHYGRWAWWGHRWVWVPGAYVARPVFAPALVGWVGGSHVNFSIHIGSGPVVGWVPLGPHEIYRPGYAHGPDYWRRINPHVPDRRPPPPQHGPIMYTNQGVPGAVTVVPANALRPSQPIAGVARGVDARTARELARQTAPATVPPPPATVRAQPSVPTQPPPGWARGVRESVDRTRDPGAEGRTWRPPSALPAPPPGPATGPTPPARPTPGAPVMRTPGAVGGSQQPGTASAGLPRGDDRAPSPPAARPGRADDENRPPPGWARERERQESGGARERTIREHRDDPRPPRGAPQDVQPLAPSVQGAQPQGPQWSQPQVQPQPQPQVQPQMRVQPMGPVMRPADVPAAVAVPQPAPGRGAGPSNGAGEGRKQRPADPGSEGRRDGRDGPPNRHRME